MRRFNLVPLCVFLFLMFFMSQCVYEEIPEEMVELPDDSVRFSTDIIPIFNTSCNSQGCHNAGGIPPDLSPENAWSDLQTEYLDLATPAASPLVVSMTDGTMAPFSTAQDIALITQWITEGAKDN